MAEPQPLDTGKWLSATTVNYASLHSATKRRHFRFLRTRRVEQFYSASNCWAILLRYKASTLAKMRQILYSAIVPSSHTPLRFQMEYHRVGYVKWSVRFCQNARVCVLTRLEGRTVTSASPIDVYLSAIKFDSTIDHSVHTSSYDSH